MLSRDTGTKKAKSTCRRAPGLHQMGLERAGSKVLVEPASDKSTFGYFTPM